MDAIDHRIGTTGHRVGEVRLAQLRTIDTRTERTESVELHRLPLRQQFLHAVHHLSEHQHAHLVVCDLAVCRHVGGKALQVQRLLRIALGKVLAVSGRVIVLVLPQVDHHWNFTSCHNLKSFLFFCIAKVLIYSDTCKLFRHPNQVLSSSHRLFVIKVTNIC